MTLDDLKADIAGNLQGGGDPQFAIILLWIIEALIFEIVRWIFERCVDPREAAEQCVVYFQHFGLAKRAALTARAFAMRLRYGNVPASASEISGGIISKMATLSADDFIEIARAKGLA